MHTSPVAPAPDTVAQELQTSCRDGQDEAAVQRRLGVPLPSRRPSCPFHDARRCRRVRVLHFDLALSDLLFRGLGIVGLTNSWRLQSVSSSHRNFPTRLLGASSGPILVILPEPIDGS